MCILCYSSNSEIFSPFISMNKRHDGRDCSRSVAAYLDLSPDRRSATNISDTLLCPYWVLLLLVLLLSSQYLGKWLGGVVPQRYLELFLQCNGLFSCGPWAGGVTEYLGFQCPSGMASRGFPHHIISSCSEVTSLWMTSMQCQPPTRQFSPSAFLKLCT